MLIVDQEINWAEVEEHAMPYLSEEGTDRYRKLLRLDLRAGRLFLVGVGLIHCNEIKVLPPPWLVVSAIVLGDQVRRASCYNDELVVKLIRETERLVIQALIHIRDDARTIRPQQIN